MAFPPNFLDQLRDRVPLAGVIGRSVRLIRKGREYSGLCPFHNEKSPSFTVNEEKGFYHCFGCGAHGDVITYVMQSQRLSFVEAVERLAEEAGLPMPQQAPEERERAKRAASLHDVLEAATKFYEAELRGPSGRQALAYLRGRGLDDETIARFRLGYSPEGRVALKSALKALPEALLIEAGMLIQPDQGDSYDRFRGRVMFPIQDRRGRIIAFGGRILGDGQPKYLNSPDTPLFHKGSVLYGLAQARQAAQDAGTIIVCEGYMDVIALQRAGFAHAVAPLGTAVTEEQLALLWSLVPEPTLCLDGDAAGQRAAMKAAERALAVLAPGQSLRFAILPSPEDPDSLIRHQGRQAMADVLAQALPLSELLWRAKFADLPQNTPEQRQGSEREVWRYFEAIPDEGLRKDYSYDFLNRLRAGRRSSRNTAQTGAGGRAPVRRGGSGPFRPGGRTEPRIPVNLRPSPLPAPDWQTQERLLITLVILHPALLEEVAEKLGELAFSDLALDKLRQEVLKHADVWRGLDFDAVRAHLSEGGFSQMLDGLLEASAHDPIAYPRPGAPLEVARRAWEHPYARYKQKDVSADLRLALQRAAEQLTDETFGYFNALWSSHRRDDESE